MEIEHYTQLDREDVLDALYEARKYAIDRECTWNVREAHWQVIDQLLDRLNEIDGVCVEIG